MFKLRNISLTLVVPLCLFSLYLAMVMGGYYYEHADLKQQLAKSQTEQLKKDLFRMRHVVDSAVQKQDFNLIDQEVALISTDMNMMVYVIVDKMSVIKFANHIIWRESDANNVLEGYSQSIHKSVIQSNKPMLIVNFDRLSIQGYYPIIDNNRFNFAQSIEVIYIEYDISELIATASDNLTSRFIQVWGVGAIILTIFCVWIYWLWIWPLARLSQAAKDIESDSFDGDFPCLSSELVDLKDYLNHVRGRLKRNQKRLNDAEQRWLFSVEGSRNGIWDWNIATGDVYVSDRWKEMLGYQSYELDSDYSVWESRLHREDKDQVLDTLQQYIDGKSNEYESVHRLRHKDGKYIWVLDRGKIVEWTEVGKPLRVIGTITDVSGDVKNQRIDVESQKPAGLTDLINREALTDSLYDLQVHSRKVNQFSAVLLLNLDNFKVINDALGHQLGDRLLMQIAARLSGAFSSSGFVARLGSDEFILLAKNLGAEVSQANKRALALASEVRQLISRSFAIADQNLSISARVGVVTCDGVESLEPQTLLARADNALEHAKEARSNGCAIYQHKLDQEQVQPFKLNHELKIALEQQQLHLVFQPVVDPDGNVASVEVLPRWHHEQYGFISPRKFIAAAELSDFIFEIELWILERVCILLNKFQSLGIEPPIMSMNISSRHFHQDHFVSIVMNRIQSSKVNTSKLQFELNEDIFVVNPLETKAKIANLQAHGIKVALDNFGSGSCAFYQLQGIYFSQVKLVASYIDEDNMTTEAQTVLCALVQLASRLNYNVIAKQVETKLQLNKLIQAKCDGFQGYLFCRPLVEDDLISLIKSHLTLNVV
ncbi:putative bifunctional diguanylate cyclase/phosphodiesterase [Shewanella aestuarii]|uniref:EAL domain-containing protein n=1 Tax=Shewanella aestuarii TaxID=1028752 RepID=A0A6G9QG12_9GAMM|nr:EAL domain-containing protein [Shewanella aestuarii]QIR13103.1 EAL domain-containing protein [Shewanella aestuarii]